MDQRTTCTSITVSATTLGTALGALLGKITWSHFTRDVHGKFQDHQFSPDSRPDFFGTNIFGPESPVPISRDLEFLPEEF